MAGHTFETGRKAGRAASGECRIRRVIYHPLHALRGQDHRRRGPGQVACRQRRADLHYLAGQPELTRLRLDLRGVDPDVASSYVALEKGYLFLRAIAESVGAARFPGVLRDFLAAFRFRSVTGEEAVAFFRGRLPGAVDYDEWLHGTGLPPGARAVTSPLLDAVRAVGQAAPGRDVAAAWSADEWQVYLAGLEPPVPAGLLTDLDGRYHLTTSVNPEILRLWLTAALRSGYQPAVPAAVDLLGRVGG
jgi:leukotriene-A4 hydrolase